MPSERVWTTVLQVTHIQLVGGSNSGLGLTTVLVVFVTVFRLRTVLVQLGKTGHRLCDITV